MDAGRASRTAEHNALFRALEHHRRHRLFGDPLAERFLSPPLRAVAAAGRVPPLGAAISRIIDRRWPGVRTSVVARTRLIDDLLETTAFDQLVLLGAGFDARAHRLVRLDEVAIFEVDHPDTQRRKLAMLRRAGISDGSVRYVATDFHLGELEDALGSAGYSNTLATMILWEGVTNYLDEPAVDATLRWCARAAPGSWLLFTYVDHRVIDEPEAYLGGRRLAATLERVGERMTFGLAPEEMPGYLEARGLFLEIDLGAAEYRRRCFGVAAEQMRGHEFYRVALARIGVR